MMALRLTRFASRRGGHKAAGEVALCGRTGLWLNNESPDSTLMRKITHTRMKAMISSFSATPYHKECQKQK